MNILLDLGFNNKYEYTNAKTTPITHMLQDHHNIPEFWPLVRWWHPDAGQTSESRLGRFRRAVRRTSDLGGGLVDRPARLRGQHRRTCMCRLRV